VLVREWVEASSYRWRFGMRGRDASATEKENRAGWPGFFCVELDAVTSQRGATGAEGAVPLLRRVHRSKDLTGKRKPTRGRVHAACHAPTCFDYRS
jgi:hypothetical protein